MPTDRETEIENALGPIRDKIGFVADSLERWARTGEKFGDPRPVALLLRDLDQQIAADVIEPMYEDRDQPVGLDLDEEGVCELVTDFYRVASATSLDKDSDEEEMRRRLGAVGRLAEVSADRICEAAGIPVHDGTIEEFLDAARPFGQKAGELGQEAVEEVVS